MVNPLHQQKYMLPDDLLMASIALVAAFITQSKQFSMRKRAKFAIDYVTDSLSLGVEDCVIAA